MLTVETGMAAVVLSYGLARVISTAQSLNLQNTFYKLQMTISNDLFVTINTDSTERLRKNSQGFDDTIRT